MISHKFGINQKYSNTLISYIQISEFGVKTKLWNIYQLSICFSDIPIMKYIIFSSISHKSEIIQNIVKTNVSKHLLPNHDKINFKPLPIVHVIHYSLIHNTPPQLKSENS